LPNHREHFTGNGGGLGNKEQIHRYQKIQAQYLDMLLKERRIYKPSVLDVGAADGYLGSCMPHWNYTAVDPDPASPVVKKGTIDDIGGPFDLIVYNHVLEHIPDAFGELMRARTRLKRRGLLFIAVPLGSTPWAWDIEAHIHLFRPEVLERWCSHQGLVPIEHFEVTFRKGKPGDRHQGPMTELWFTARRA